MSESPRPADRSWRFGLAALIGTFLFIPLWDVFALISTLLTGQRARKNSDTHDQGLSLILHPLRRLIIVGLAYALAMIGVGNLLGTPPGPFGLLGAGANNLISIAQAQKSDCCDLSSVTKKPVSDMIAAGLPETLWLLGSAMVMSLIFTSLLFGAAVWIQRLARTRGVTGEIIAGVLRLGAFRLLAVPASGMGLLAILYLSIRFHVFPVGLSQSYFAAPGDLGDRIYHMILPASMIALLPSLLAAQGAWRVWTRWAEPAEGRWGATMLEAAHNFYEQSGWLLVGILTVEPLFAITGLGKLLVDAILGNDLAVTMRVVLVLPLIMLVFRLRTVLLDSVHRAYLFEHPLPVPAAPKPARKKSATKDENPSRQTIWLGIAGLAILFVLIPMVRSWVASPHDPLTALDAKNVYALPSAEYVMGTDSQGRDVQSRIFQAHGVSLGIALGGAMLALLVGGVWGGAVTALRRWRGLLGESLGDLLRLPAEALMILHPAIVAMIFTVGRWISGGDLPSLTGMAAAIGLSVAVRAAWSVEPLWEARPQHRSVRFQLLGILLILFTSGMYVVFMYSETLSFLSMGVLDPVASLGNNIAQYTGLLMGTQAVKDVRFFTLSVWFVDNLTLQGWALYTLQDAVADWFEFTRRDYLPKFFG
jgi:ABC-type dipeptide/oligopeptide/nickel transport system permease component